MTGGRTIGHSSHFIDGPKLTAAQEANLITGIVLSLPEAKTTRSSSDDGH